MRYIVFLLFLFSFTIVNSQSVEIINFDELETKWAHDNDTLYVVNYWATWCKPCVEELPDFLKLEEEMQGEKFKMILVSLDFPSHLESRVLPFIEKENIKPEVVILDDNANVWINKVDESWDGDIPVTQFIKNNEKTFYGEELDYKRLKEIVKNYK